MSSQDLSIQLEKHLNVRKVSLVAGGPSPSDPMGEIAQYLGVIDDFGNSYFFGVSDTGRITKVGCTVNGRKYELPATEQL